MKKLDQRGVAALEFCIIGAIFFVTMFVVVDFARYAGTVHSLRILANAGARDLMINCYTDAVTTKTNNTSPSGCVSYTPLSSDSAKQAVVPFLFSADGHKPTISVTAGTNLLTVTASLPSFTMLTPFWSIIGVSLPTTASTTVPYPS